MSNASEQKTLQTRLIEFRDESEGKLTGMTDSLYGGDKTIVGKWRQALGNVLLWYGQWDKNRDYSSVVNASLALGKLAPLNELMGSSIMEGGSYEVFEVITTGCTELCNECWENIRAAAGRIVPFEG